MSYFVNYTRLAVLSIDLSIKCKPVPLSETECHTFS